MTVLPTVQHDLSAAAIRQSRRGATRRRARRVSVIAATGVVALGGVALAARVVGVWEPTSKQLHGAKISVSRQAPPASQLATFGVLRRPQTARDRNTHVLTALRHSTNLTGIRTDYIRLLYQQGTSLFVLLPAEAWHVKLPSSSHLPATARRALSVRDPLCLYVQDAKQTDSWTGGCQSTQSILAGGSASIGRTLYGLVPDGVQIVRITRRGAPAVEVRTHENFFHAVLPRSGHGPTHQAWLDVSRRIVGPPCPFKPGACGADPPTPGKDAHAP